MGLSRTISEIKGDICKIFPTHAYLTPSAGFPLEFCNGGWLEKPE